jgi:hypothetical protein
VLLNSAMLELGYLGCETVHSIMMQGHFAKVKCSW